MPVTSPPAAPPAAPAGGGGMAGPPPAAPPGPARAGHSARPAAESPYQAPAEPPEPEAPAPSVGHGAKAPTGGPATPGTESGTAGPESREETGGADSAAGRQPGTRPVPVGSPAAPPGGYGPPRYSTTQLATPAEAPYPAPRVPGAPAGGEKAATTATGPKRGRAKVVALAVAGVLVFAAAGGGTAYALLHGGDASTRADAGPTGDASTDPPTQPSDEPSGEPSAGGESSKSAVPNPEPVEHDGINLPADYHLYFASDSATPRNDQDDSAPDLTYRDSFGDKSLETSDGSKLVLLNNAQQGGLETCRQETRFADSIDFDRISKGSRVCVRTGSGHIALVTFKGFAPDSDPSDYITIDLTLWRNALDAESAS